MGAVMANRTVRFIASQNMLIDRLMADFQTASAAYKRGILLCLEELGVPGGQDVNFEEVLQNRSFTWEVADAEKQPPDGAEVEGV